MDNPKEATERERIAQFTAQTGAPTQARALLVQHGWDVDKAAAAYLTSALPRPGMGGAAPKRTGVAGFGGVADAPKSDTNTYYTGGHSSGVAVVGGPDGPGGQGGAAAPHAVDRLTQGAKAAGAVVDAHAAPAAAPAFAGSGQSLSGARVDGPAPPPRQLVRVLAMYDDGFTVDDGPFRAFADAANAEFLADVEAGTVPRELEREAHAGGAQLQVDLVDKRGQKYAPPAGKPKPAVAAFTGSGHALSAPSAAAAAAVPAAALAVDSTQPTTRVQFRGSDGARVVGTFNETHTLAQCMGWLAGQRGAPVRAVSVAGPPARTLAPADLALTLRDAKLQGATIIFQ